MHGKTAILLLSLVGLALAAPAPAAAPGNAESAALKSRVPDVDDVNQYYSRNDDAESVALKPRVPEVDDVNQYYSRNDDADASKQ